jgi:hypothetical protein
MPATSLLNTEGHSEERPRGKWDVGVPSSARCLPEGTLTSRLAQNLWRAVVRGFRALVSSVAGARHQR